MTRLITLILTGLAWLHAGLGSAATFAQPAKAASPTTSGPVGSVHGQPIQTNDFLRYLVARHRSREFGKHLLENLRDRILVEQGMARWNVEVAPGDVDQAYEKLDRRVRAETGGKQSLADILRSKGTDLDEFRTYLRRLVAVRKIVRLQKKTAPDADIPDDEVRAWLQEQARTAIVITDPAKLPADVVLRIGARDVDVLTFGHEILDGLALPDRARELNQLLHERVVQAALKAHDITLTEADMDHAVDQERRRYAENPRTRGIPYESILQQMGTSVAERKQNASFRANAAILKMARALHSEADLKTYYESNPDRFGPSRHIRHILVRTTQSSEAVGPGLPQEKALERVRELRRRIVEKGEAFEKVARTESDDRSRFQNGDLGFVHRKDRMDPALTQAAFSLQIGTVSEPIQTRHGYHLVQVVEEKPAAPFAEVREGVLRARAQDWFQDEVARARLTNRYLDELKKRPAGEAPAEKPASRDR